MKKLFLIVLFLFALALPSLLLQAGQTRLITYFPPTSGSYSQVQVADNGNLDCSTKDASNNYVNAGRIWVDTTTGDLNICTPTGTTESYPHSCFNRFCTYES